MTTQEKVLSALSYVGILFILPLIIEPKTDFTRFHANQGLVLFIAELIGYIALSIISFILAFIPIIGTVLSYVLYLVFSIGCLVLMILGIINAVQERQQPLPIIGGFTIIK